MKVRTKAVNLDAPIISMGYDKGCDRGRPVINLFVEQYSSRIAMVSI